jgi:hypothetical protein
MTELKERQELAKDAFDNLYSIIKNLSISQDEFNSVCDLLHELSHQNYWLGHKMCELEANRFK